VSAAVELEDPLEQAESVSAVIANEKMIRIRDEALNMICTTLVVLRCTVLGSECFSFVSK
jgi:hypothetical protein